MRKPGCYDHPPFRETVTVQDGYTHRPAATTRLPRMVQVPFGMEMTCQYTRTTLGRKDDSCNGCKWKDNVI